MNKPEHFIFSFCTSNNGLLYSFTSTLVAQQKNTRKTLSLKKFYSEIFKLQITINIMIVSPSPNLSEI